MLGLFWVIEAEDDSTGDLVPMHKGSTLIQGDYDVGRRIIAIRSASLAQGAGALIEALMECPAEFQRDHAAYLSMCDDVDRECAGLLNGDPGDVIVDDKISCYRMEDYLKWGGHRREFSAAGEETVHLAGLVRAVGNGVLCPLVRAINGFECRGG